MAAGEERRKQALILSRIRRLQRRLNGEVWLREAVVPLWCAATAAALHRLLIGSHTAWFIPLFFCAAGAVWWWRVRKRRLTEGDAAILLDRGAGAGGLLLTRLELPVGAWELGLNESVRRAPLPDVQRTRPAALSGMALLFLAVAMLVPLPERKPPLVNAAAASRVAQLEAQAEALARELPLEESLEAELARLREELAAGAFDAADWEAADHTAAALAREAAEAQAELGRAAEAADALEQALAKAQGAGAAAREREALERSLMSLDETAGSGAEAMQKALDQLGSERNSGEERQGQGGDAPDGAGKPSSSELSQLRDALRDRQEQMANAFKQGGKNGQGRQMAKSAPQPGQGQAQGKGQGQGPATGERGGPSRGGGEGELRFDQPVEMDPSRLAFAPLPEGQGGDPGQLWGLKAADPKPSTEPSGGAMTTGSLVGGEQAPAFDQSARLPRNRELVRRYFDSQHP